MNYVYNGDGQRIQKTEGTQETNYFYQNGAVVKTTNKEGNQSALYLYGNSSNAIAIEDGTGEKLTSYTYTKDVQGSIMELVGADEKSVIGYQYDAYGNTTITGKQTTANELAYTGGVYDKTTEEYYLNARYYDPADGRFLTQDTYRGEETDASTWNLYSYCGGNPANYVDPSGHAPAYMSDYALKGSIDIGTITAIKGLRSSWDALKTISFNEKQIKKVAKRFSILSDMIRAILYREITCYGIDDVIADKAVRINYSKNWLYKKFSKIKSKTDSSTGLAQIFAKTAIHAEKVVLGESNYFTWGMWKKLQDNKTNIYYCGMVLKSIMKEKRYANIKAKQYGKIKAVFARYNGTNNAAKNMEKRS